MTSVDAPLNEVPIKRLSACGRACTCAVVFNTYAVECAVCHKTKYPTLPEPPGPDWICARCRAGGG
jgi:hypothetical protein